MIPKIIHYIWFGRNPLPPLAKECLKSWKKYCPDYEVREWNEDNFDLDSAPAYVQEAYQAKKWAFASDYVRLWALVNYGGIYMDTDVEVTKNLDRFLEHEAFSGFESQENIPTGIMACRKDFPLFKSMLQEYNTRHFLKEDGSFDMTTNTVAITNWGLEHGLVLNNQLQDIEGFMLYPNEFFCPKSLQTGIIHATENTHAIHHFNASWFSEKERLAYKKHLITLAIRYHHITSADYKKLIEPWTPANVFWPSWYSLLKLVYRISKISYPTACLLYRFIAIFKRSWRINETK